jgi:hemerythrin superfamily protein
MKITVLLRNDHETLKTLFHQFNKPTQSRTQDGKKDLFNEIRREVLIHSQMERDVFYPAVRTIASPEADDLLSRAEREHVSVEKLLQELNVMNGTEKNFEAKMTQLIDEVLGHIEMEEDQMFEEVRKNLPEYRLEELGLELEDRKRILVTIAA